MPSNSNLPLSRRSDLSYIFIREHRVLFNVLVDGVNSDLIVISSPLRWIKLVKVLLLIQRWTVRFNEMIDPCAENIPVCVIHRKMNITLIFIANRVPDRMKVGDTVSVGHFEVIASSVASGIVGVDSGDRVKRLMNVTQVVNQQSHGKGFTFSLSELGMQMRHNLLIGVCELKAFFLFHPTHNFGNGSSHIMAFRFEKRIVCFCAALIEISLVDEVPEELVVAWVSRFIYDVSKCGALDEWVFIFNGVIWSGFVEVSKDLFCCFKSIFIFFN